MKINVENIELTKNKLYDEDTIVKLVANQIFDYFSDKGEFITHLKLQKLLYYCCSYKYTFSGTHFNEVQINFQAWVHGPVNRYLYDILKHKGNDFYKVEKSDLNYESNYEVSLEDDDITIINDVLNSYGDLSGTQLETLTHMESPWINARQGLGEYSSSTNEILYEDIRNEYLKNLV